jgi:phosphatidylglycerol:prolipoprotein diacylglycerol transferase
VDPGDSGQPYDAVIRFSGRRAAPAGAAPGAGHFVRQETVRLVSGSGPVAVTTRAENVAAGDWLVRARPDGRARMLDPDALPPGARPRPGMRSLRAKGNPVAPGASAHASSRASALATAPGIVPGAWAALVATGAAAGIIVLMILLARQGAGAGAPAVVAAALLAGAAGARGWYVMLQRGKVSGPPVRGLAVQGFIAGAALAAVPGLLLTGIPAGAFAGAAAPALFLAMAIGRQGCFLAGCCAGRPTASRWGLWSSDGRIGARRIPAQQLEALACLLIGGAALAAFLRAGQPAGVTILAGALASWTLARQWLLATRAEPRRWNLAAPVTAAVAAAALIADIIIAAV